MFSSERRFSFLMVLMIVSVVSVSGCATKGFVQESVSPVEVRVSDLESSSDELGEQIDAVDERSQQGIQQATTAAQSAQTAANAAGDSAAAAGRSAETAQQGATQANTRVTAVETRLNTLNNYSVAQTVTVQFALESATLTDAAMATLGGIAGQLRAGDFLEIQGFTDSTGDVNYNEALSERRASAVQRYLVTQNVPLFRTEIVGLGTASPVADNSTREGREQNRRVEVRLLRAGN
jgi:outer membrane protein OmpA-like peptidoglycan-associated protein